MSEHTQGPWEWQGRFLWATEAQCYVLRSPSGYSHIEGRAVDKDLIAAVPDLLAALEDLLYQRKQLRGEETQALSFDQAKAAITEAKGNG